MINQATKALLEQLRAAYERRDELDAEAHPVRLALKQLPSGPMAPPLESGEVDVLRSQLKTLTAAALLGRAGKGDVDLAHHALRTAEAKLSKFAAGHARDVEVSEIGRAALAEILAPLDQEHARLGTLIDGLSIDYLVERMHIASEEMQAIEMRLGESTAELMALAGITAVLQARLPIHQRKPAPMASGAMIEVVSVPSLRGFAGCTSAHRRVIFDARLVQPMPGDVTIDGAAIAARIRTDIEAALGRH